MDDKKPYKYHPIQLIDIKVLTLHYEIVENSDLPNDNPNHDQGENDEFYFYKNHSEYDRGDKRFVVKIKAELKKPADDTLGYSMLVELGGVFEVDEDKFDVTYVNSFADKNAPLVLYPYLREQIFGLATRAGIISPMLPLFEVPQFKGSEPIERSSDT